MRLESAAGQRLGLSVWQADSRGLESGGTLLVSLMGFFFPLSFLCGMFIKDLGWSREKVACSLGLPHVLFHYWFYLFFFFSYFCAVHLISGVWREGLVSVWSERLWSGGDRSMVGGVSFQLTSKLCHFVASKGTTTAGWGLQLLLWHRWQHNAPTQEQDGLQHLCRTWWPSRSSEEQST